MPENKICLQCGANFQILDSDLDFYYKISPIFNDKVYQIPAPKLCSNCRKQRRLAFRNERKLYKRKCDLCNKDIISVCHKNANFPVYCQDCWWSDKWDTKDFGQDFDFKRGFFEQFNELQKKVPRWSNIVVNSENSDYCINCDATKNSYLIIASLNIEDCLYSTRLSNSKDCVDCYNLYKSELCYECMDSENIYNSTFCQNCKSCSDIDFCFDLQSCNNCFLCTNLRNKKFNILNQQYSEKDFFAEKNNLLKKNKDELWKIFKKFKLENYHRENVNIHSEDCLGDYLFNSKNLNQCFFVFNSEDCRFVTNSKNAINCHDCSDIDDQENCYETGSSIWCNGTHFSENMSGNNSFYCMTSMYIDNCFACIGLKKQKYCIFNKQYSKEEYEQLVPKIIEHMQKTGEWGEFFPISLSPFAYNETIAQNHFPSTKEGIISMNWKWKEEKDPIPKVGKIIPANMLPENINDIPDDVLNWNIKCAKTNRPYKIQKSELAFYRKMNLPIPRLHPDIRNKERIEKRNPQKLWERNCFSCNKKIQTTYSPDRAEKVLCEECYLKKIH